jgi:hypothetical protein
VIELVARIVPCHNTAAERRRPSAQTPAAENIHPSMSSTIGQQDGSARLCQGRIEERRKLENLCGAEEEEEEEEEG